MQANIIPDKTFYLIRYFSDDLKYLNDEYNSPVVWKIMTNKISKQIFDIINNSNARITHEMTHIRITSINMKCFKSVLSNINV